MNKWSYRVVFDWILTTYGRFAYVRRARDASAAAGACRTPAVLHGMVQWTAAGEYARTHARTHLPVWQQNRRANSACFKHAYIWTLLGENTYIMRAEWRGTGQCIIVFSLRVNDNKCLCRGMCEQAAAPVVATFTHSCQSQLSHYRFITPLIRTFSSNSLPIYVCDKQRK